LNFEDFKKVIKEDTSEMLLALMQIIHSNLPCASAIFQMKKECANQSRKTETIAAPKEMSNYFFLNPVAIEAHISQVDAESRFTLDENSARSSEGSVESPSTVPNKMTAQFKALSFKVDKGSAQGGP